MSRHQADDVFAAVDSRLEGSLGALPVSTPLPGENPTANEPVWIDADLVRRCCATGAFWSGHDVSEFGSLTTNAHMTRAELAGEERVARWRADSLAVLLGVESWRLIIESDPDNPAARPDVTDAPPAPEKKGADMPGLSKDAPRPFPCPIEGCDYAANTARGLSVHVGRDHKKKPEPKITAPRKNGKTGFFNEMLDDLAEPLRKQAALVVENNRLRAELIDTHLRLICADLEAAPGVPLSLRESIEGRVERVQELVKEAIGR